MNFLFVFNFIFYALNLSLFSWAISSFFTRDSSGSLPKGMKRLTMMGSIVAVLQTIALFRWHSEEFSLQVAAFLLLSASLVLFISALKASKRHQLPIAFSKIQPSSICMNGPYRKVRHPFYLSYALTWAAPPLMSGFWLLFLTTAFMICLYWKMAAEEEALLLNGPHGNEYKSYMRSAWRLLPKIF